MTSSARADLNTSLYFASGSSGSTYSLAGEITSLGIPDLQFPVTEVTNVSTSGSGYPEFIHNGKKIISEFPVTVNFVKTVFTGFQFYAASGSLMNYHIRFPDAGSTTFSFAGLITSIKIKDTDAKNPDVLSVEMKIQPSGVLTIS